MENFSLFFQEYWYLALFILAFASFIAGFVDSIAGGGGLFLLPAFLLTGFPAQMAMGQGKLISGLGTLAAIRNFMSHKQIIWKMLQWGIIPSLLGSFAGAQLILFFSNEMAGKIVLFLLPLGILLHLIPKKTQTNTTIIFNKNFYLKTIIITFCIGFYDGFFGPGTGSFLIMTFHALLHFNLVQASANAKIFNFSSNTGGLLAFILAGKVLYFLAIPLALVNILGNHLGSKIMLQKGQNFVRYVLTFSMLCLFVSLLWRYL